MNDNLAWTELARLPVAKMQDVLIARFIGRDEAAKMGFSPTILTRVCTAISETTRNVVQHAGCPGEIHIGHLTGGPRIGLRIIVSDPGRGMANPGQYLATGKSSLLGSGLEGTRRLVDHFDLQSEPDKGTTVTMDFWPPPDPAP
jgi:serine/threonine-protein kinase RsbT